MGIPPSMRKETIQNDIDRGYFSPPSIGQVMEQYQDNGNRWKFSDHADQSKPEPVEKNEIVNADDLAAPPTADQIYESWNLALGEPGFNPAADANNDGIINSLDLEFVVQPEQENNVAGKAVASWDSPPDFGSSEIQLPPGIQLTPAQAAAMAQYGPLNF